MNDQVIELDEVAKESFLDNLKKVIGPMAMVLVPVTGAFVTLLYFAADAKVRAIVQEEIGAGQLTNTSQSTTLTEHTSLLAQHDEEIEDNEGDIDDNKDEFRQFMRDVLDRM